MYFLSKGNFLLILWSICLPAVRGGSFDPSFCFICDEGYYGSPPNHPCTKCPVSPGIHCPPQSSYPFVYPGFWRIDVVTIFPCNPAAACESTGTNNYTVCSPGYTGQNCGLCDNSYRRLSLDCKPCPAKWLQVIQILLFCALLLFILVRIYVSQGGISADTKITIQSLQILALYSGISPNWPPYLLSLFNALSLTVTFLLLSDFDYLYRT
jgi:hypothetical protein